MTSAQMKERALFYVDRRLKALAETEVNHVGAATAGLSYAARLDLEKRTEEQNKQNEHEREALQWLRDQAVEKL